MVQFFSASQVIYASDVNICDLFDSKLTMRMARYNCVIFVTTYVSMPVDNPELLFYFFE